MISAISITEGAAAAARRHTEVGLGNRLPYVVARGFGPHGVFGGQGDAAHGDDQQDAHLEVTQGADVVTRPTEPGGTLEHFYF